MHYLSQKHRKVTPNSHMRNTNVHLNPKGAVKIDQIKKKIYRIGLYIENDLLKNPQ